MDIDYKNGNVLMMLNNLPSFIQKGKLLCKLNITKNRRDFIVAYTNAKDDYFVFGEDLEDVLKRMIIKLNNPPSSKYRIHFGF